MADVHIHTLNVHEGATGVASSRAVRTPFCTLPSYEDIRFVGRTTELTALDAWGHSDRRVMVVHGAPGVGKTRLATEWSHRHPEFFPGGRYFLSFRADPYEQLHEVARLCGVRREPDERLDQWAIRTLHHLGAEQALVVFDDLQSPDAFKVWFERLSVARALVVTNERVWPAGYAKLPVDVLVPDDARALVRQVIDDEAVAATHAERIVVRTGRNAVQLVVDAGAVHDAAALGDTPSFPPMPAPEVLESFERGWRVATEDAQTLVCVLALFRAQNTPLTRIVEVLRAEGWTEERTRAAISAAVRRHLVTRTEDWALTLHPLLRTFARAKGTAVLSNALRTAHARAFVAQAQAFARSPGDRGLYAALAQYEFERDAWETQSESLPGEDFHWIGEALREAGYIAEAKEWYEQAAVEKHQGEVYGRIDHNSLGWSLHQVGHCLVYLKQFDEASRWYEQAVTEKHLGDVHERVDHKSVGISLHGIGFCLSEQGKFTEAFKWYEQAVAEKRHGDIHGRIDHTSIGTSLHQVGLCLSEQGQFAKARSWYEQAASEMSKGDAQGRINHESIGISLHQVGFCLSSQGQFADACEWYEQASHEMSQGDIHGRINHVLLGISLHQVGFCLSEQGQFAEARSWYERAANEVSLGDVHGRIDHVVLGSSLHQAGFCLSEQGQFAEARSWYEKAATEKRLGNVIGSVNTLSLAHTLECLATVLDHVNLPDEARAAREEAERLRTTP